MKKTILKVLIQKSLFKWLEKQTEQQTVSYNQEEIRDEGQGFWNSYLKYALHFKEKHEHNKERNRKAWDFPAKTYTIWN